MTELTLYLLRHGESVANAQRRYSARRTDPPLSALGEEQARRQGEALRVAQFTAILVSPLLRARQTAEIVSRGMGPRPVVCNALIEVDVGILDGENVDDPQGQRVYNEVITGWEQGQEDVGFPGGETLHDVRRRLERLLQVLAPQSGNVLLVGHSLFFAALLWLYCENRRPSFREGHMGRGRLAVITRVDGCFRLDSLDVAPGSCTQESWPTDLFGG